MNLKESYFGDQNLPASQGYCYWQTQWAWRFFTPSDLPCSVLGKSEISLSKCLNLQNGETNIVILPDCAE